MGSNTFGSFKMGMWRLSVHTPDKKVLYLKIHRVHSWSCISWGRAQGGHLLRWLSEDPAAARAPERAQLCLLIFSIFSLHFPSALQRSIHLWVAEPCSARCLCPQPRCRKQGAILRCLHHHSGAGELLWKGKLGSSSSTKLRWEITFKTKRNHGF